MAARDSQLAGIFLPYFIVFACGAPLPFDILLKGAQA